MLKKFIAALVAGALVIGTLTTSPVYADEAGVNATQQADASTQRGCDIGAELGVSYSISIPKLITLNGVSGQAVYSVTVAGDIAGNQKVLVIPEESFLLHESGHKADVRAVVEQTKTEWNYLDLWANEKTGTTAQGTVSAPITAGTWNGNFMFNLSLEGEIETPGSGDIDTLDTPETPEETGMTEEERLAAEAAAAEALAQQVYDSAVSAATAKAATLVTVNGSDEAFDTENEVHDYLEAQYNEAVAPYGYTATVNCVYVAPVHGTHENPAGVDGSYTYSVSITNGAKTFETEEMTLILSAVSHDYILTSHRDATCEENGYDIYTCNDCEDSYTVDIVASGHNIVIGRCLKCNTQFPGYYSAEGELLQALTVADFTESAIEVTPALPAEPLFDEDNSLHLLYNPAISYTQDDLHQFTNMIVVPDGVQYVNFNGKQQAFQNVETVVLPEGLLGINDGAFQCMQQLKNITLPASLQYIGTRAFCRCKALQSINLPANLEAIGSECFRQSGLQSISVPKATTILGEAIFCECASLTSASIDADVEYLPMDTFNYCLDLTNINLSETINYIGPYSIKNCRSLISINISDKVTNIGFCAFSGCTSLENIELPQVQYIQTSAFSGCSNLTDITMPNVITIGKGAFAGCPNLAETPDETPDETPISENDINDGLYGCFDADGNQVLKWSEMYIDTTVEDGYVSSSNRTRSAEKELIAAHPEITKIVIPDGIVEIGKYALTGTSAKEIVIPDTVTKIDNYAFATNQNLESVIIPDSVTSIGDYAFYDCTGLTSIAIPDNVTSIGAHTFGVTVFKNTSSLTTIYYNGTATGAPWGATNATVVRQ